VLTALVQQLIRQEKGQGKVSDPTPEASGEGGGRPQPPRHGAAGAPGGEGDPDDEGEGSRRKPDRSRKGSRDERPAPQPEDKYDAEDDEQVNLSSRVRSDAVGQRSRVPAERPALWRKEKHQDIRMWLLTCTEYFGQNSGHSKEEAQ